MVQTAELRCHCGKVEGHVADAAPKTVNHAICYCDDCQAFAHHLRRLGVGREVRVGRSF